MLQNYNGVWCMYIFLSIPLPMSLCGSVLRNISLSFLQPRQVPSHTVGVSFLVLHAILAKGLSGDSHKIKSPQSNAWVFSSVFILVLAA